MADKDELEAWLEGLGPDERSAAAAFLIFAMFLPYKKAGSKEFWRAARSALRKFAADRVQDPKRAAREPYGTATPRVAEFASLAYARSLLPDVSARMAAELWVDEFSKPGKKVFWRIGVNDAPDEPSFITALSALASNPSIGVLGIAWVQDGERERTRWRWPLRIGYLAGDAAIADAIANATRGVHRGLTRIIPLGDAAEQCDLLLASNPDLGRNARIAASASVFIKPFAEQHTVGQAWTAMHDWKSSAVGLVTADPTKYVRELLDSISHDYPIDSAIHDASHSLNLPTPPVIVADGEFLQGTTIRGTMHRMTRRPLVRAIAPGLARDIPAILANAPWDSERHGATVAAAKAEELESAARSSQNVPRQLLATSVAVPFWTGKARSSSPPVRALARDALNILDVWIGIAADTEEGLPFDEDKVEWGEHDEVELDVAFMSAAGYVLEHPAVQELLLYRSGLSVEEELLLKVPPPAPAREPRRSKTQSLRTIRLRRGGDSSHALIPFVIDEGIDRLSGRIILSQGNRVLMTASVSGSVTSLEEARRERRPGDRPHLELRAEGVVRTDIDEIDETREFDMAFVANHTSTGEGRAAAVGNRAMSEIDFKDAGKASGVISGHLVQLCAKPDEFGAAGSPRYAAFLFDLAQHGSALYDTLVEDTQLKAMIARGEVIDRLQVVSANPDAILPLEFVYEGDGPVPGAPVCPNAVAAMQAEMSSWAQPRSARTSGCPATCGHRRAASHVCPMRFWGLTKTIERHAFDPDSEAPLSREFRVSGGEPVAGKTAIAKPQHAVLASSKDAWSQMPAALGALRAGLDKITSNVSEVTSWPDWCREVQGKKPTLLVAVPHQGVMNGNEYLEIHDGSKADLHDLFYGNVTEGTVKADEALVVLVFLIGCETALPAKTYSSFPARFRRKKANIVVATLSPILGRFGGPIAGEILGQLGDCWNSSSEPVTLGEIMRRARLLNAAKGNPIGFTLVAYGDADWSFGRA